MAEVRSQGSPSGSRPAGGPSQQPLTDMRFRLQPVDRCVSQAEKIANIQRHMQALETTHRELLKIQDRLDLANKAYTFARLVKDTSIGFLDLAASALAGPAGRTARGGIAAIDAATSLSEIAHGQGNAATIAMRTANSVNSLINADTPVGKVVQMKANQALGLTQGILDMNNAANRADRQQQVEKMGVALTADSIASIAGLASVREGDVSSKVGRVAELVKAAYNYNAALTETFDQRLRTVEDIRATRDAYIHSHRMAMIRLRANLTEALALLQSCSADNPR